MQKEKNISTQEVISMEEYLNKRQKIREQEKKNSFAGLAPRLWVYQRAVSKGVPAAKPNCGQLALLTRFSWIRNGWMP